MVRVIPKTGSLTTEETIKNNSQTLERSTSEAGDRGPDLAFESPPPHII